jgi:type II secretory pathway pseudopilin PulG
MTQSQTGNPKTKLRDFTIAELLVVIVVIATVAAITVGAYSGIQQRANNSVSPGPAS